MARSLLFRVARGVVYALLGPPARQRIGTLPEPRRMLLEAAVTTPDEVHTRAGQPAAWTRVELLERRRGLVELGEDIADVFENGDERPAPKTMHVVGEVVRGAELVLSTAHGEVITIPAGTFTVIPARRTPALLVDEPIPDATWPAEALGTRYWRELVLRRGDLVRFEATIVPERHPRSGGSYRGGFDVRYRVQPEPTRIELTEVDEDDR